MELKTGSRWQSSVCGTEVVVIRPPNASIRLECGGAEMVPYGTPQRGGTIGANAAAGSLVGKRYVDQQTGLELLCTKAGAGSLAIDGRTLTIKQTKPLPSSD
jgi:hypothetical protein